MVLKIGHRGCGYADENSLAAIRKAIEVGVDAIEIDLRTCKSGEIVIIHDETVDRTSDGKGAVVDKTFGEIKKLKSKNNEQIPSLQEVLDLVDKKTTLIFHLKTRELVEPVSKVIDKYVNEKGWSYDNFIVESFSSQDVSEFRKLCPAVRVLFLLSWDNVLSIKRIRYLKFAEREKIYGLSVDYKRLHGAMIYKAHEKGLRVIVWTLDEPILIKRFKKMGVDGIISDYPDIIDDA